MIVDELREPVVQMFVGSAGSHLDNEEVLEPRVIFDHSRDDVVVGFASKVCKGRGVDV